MNEKALRILEYHKIIGFLEDLAGSEPGKRLCRELAPMTVRNEIEKSQQETADALARLFRNDRISFGGNCDMKGILKSLEIGGHQSPKELLMIARLLETVNHIKSYNNLTDSTTDDRIVEDSLTDYFECLSPLPLLLADIRKCILSEEEISDEASPELKRIRRGMVQANDKIHTLLTQMVNTTYRTYLQDTVITMRDDRYCIPVKSEYKNQVTGMVHDQSSTGSTFFIEPAAVVNLNNRIRELHLEEEAEIEQILIELTAKAAAHEAELAADSHTLTLLDFIFAKARLAINQNATRPIFSNDHYVHIRKGRHPLLDRKIVVPIDITLGRDYDLLIITGPNTGGKTVSLKTMGLLTLMGQSGLHIPALDRSELSIFHEVYADIGDEQSIEQSLSTFSSHMTNIVRILEEADDDSLCLFDELGAGTDPTEGAALAIAILKQLHDFSICTMATTHYSELKVFALSTQGVENACCEFDVETLRPTYHLLIGIPGKSNAFAISKKLGLSDRLIEIAREQLTQSEEDFEDLLSNLETSRKTIEKEQLEIEKYKKEIETLKIQVTNRQEKLEQTRDEILREANEEARDILKEAKQLADETIRDIQKGNITIAEMERKRTKVRDKMNERNEQLTRKNVQTISHNEIDPKKLKLGDLVKVVSMGLKGTVSSLPDSKGNLFVQCGIIRSQTNLKNLELLADDELPINLKPSRTSYGSGLSKAQTISTEINLVGKQVDEAIALLDKYLDDAYLAHLSSVRIVHGKGTGALRAAVGKHLKKTSYIKSFRQGEYGEGDAGVTIAEFKQ